MMWHLQGCQKDFTSVMDRRKHLIDFHLYPSRFHFDRLHLGKKTGQQRPAREFQKGRGGKTVAKTSSRDGHSNRPFPGFTAEQVRTLLFILSELYSSRKGLVLRLPPKLRYLYASKQSFLQQLQRWKTLSNRVFQYTTIIL